MEKIIKKLKAQNAVITYKGTYKGFAGIVSYIIYYFDFGRNPKDEFGNDCIFYTLFYKKGKTLDTFSYPLLEVSIKDAYYKAMVEDLRRKNQKTLSSHGNKV